MSVERVDLPRYVLSLPMTTNCQWRPHASHLPSIPLNFDRTASRQQCSHDHQLRHPTISLQQYAQHPLHHFSTVPAIRNCRRTMTQWHTVALGLTDANCQTEPNECNWNVKASPQASREQRRQLLRSAWEHLLNVLRETNRQELRVRERHYRATDRQTDREKIILR